MVACDMRLKDDFDFDQVACTACLPSSRQHTQSQEMPSLLQDESEPASPHIPKSPAGGFLLDVHLVSPQKSLLDEVSGVMPPKLAWQPCLKGEAGCGRL